MKKAYIIGHISAQEELSVFLSTRGQLGEQYLDDMQIFFSLEKAKEVCEKHQSTLPAKVYEISLKEV